MVTTMLILTAVFVAFIGGYWMGFKACFDYLNEELRKFREGEQ